MRPSLVSRFLATPALLAKAKVKKPKAEYIVVRCRSVVSDYPVNKVRPRLDDKLEFLCWDPMVQREVLYREEKKVRSVPPNPNGEELDFACMISKDRHKEETWYRLRVGTEDPGSK
jgi:hypothetical protein